MFRIDRNFVNLSFTRHIQIEDGEGTEAGAVGEALNAAASTAYMAEIQAQAQAEAQEIIEDAKTKAEQIIQEARDEKAQLMINLREQAEEDRRKAVQEGYAEGSEEGKRSYDEKIAEKIREDDGMLKNVINEIYDERERTYGGLEDMVVGLALEIVRKVINPAEEAIGGIFESLVKNALKQLSPDGKIVIRISAAEYERFFSSGSAVFNLDNGVELKTSILRDVSLGSGDLIIDTESETINAGLDTQLKYIALAFEKLIVEN